MRECTHGCGMCNGRLRPLEVTNSGFQWWTCDMCGEQHVEIDCCERPVTDEQVAAAINSIMERP